MLLRIGVLYALSVLSVVLGIMVFWQSMQLRSIETNYAVLTKRYDRLAKESAQLRTDLESVERRARVAEDSLSRTQSPSQEQASAGSDEVDTRALRAELETAKSEAAALAEAHANLEAQLSEVAKARDAALKDQATLRAKVEAAEQIAASARSDAKRAADEIVAQKSKAAAVPALPAPAAEVPTPVPAPTKRAAPETGPAAAQASAPAPANKKTGAAVKPPAQESWSAKVVAPPAVPKVGASGAVPAAKPVDAASPVDAPANDETATKGKIDPTSAPLDASVPEEAAGGPVAEIKPAKAKPRPRPAQREDNPLDLFFPF